LIVCLAASEVSRAAAAGIDTSPGFIQTKSSASKSGRISIRGGDLPEIQKLAMRFSRELAFEVQQPTLRLCLGVKESFHDPQEKAA